MAQQIVKNMITCRGWSNSMLSHLGLRWHIPNGLYVVRLDIWNTRHAQHVIFTTITQGSSFQRPWSTSIWYLRRLSLAWEFVSAKMKFSSLCLTEWLSCMRPILLRIVVDRFDCRLIIIRFLNRKLLRRVSSLLIAVLVPINPLSSV